MNRIKQLEFYLPNEFKGMTKQYILDCYFNDKIQNNWSPNIVDVIVGNTGNIFVISGHHRTTETLGGNIYFFGGFLYAEADSCRMTKHTCYAMNKWII